ncbi:S24 family peptidase [Parabacteroides distasonis]|uniref:S24 family peptidase n=1 Tax=Parabacteroides distasonis TaxID=823 RepID=UPI00321BB65D
MGDFCKNIVTERFIQVFNNLKDRVFFETNKEFADSIDYLPQSLGEVLKGRRDVTIEVIRKLVIEYPISLDYIFTGEGTMLIEDKNRWLPKWLPKWLPTDGNNSESRKTKSTPFEKEETKDSLFLPDSGKTKSTNIVELPVPVTDESEMVSVPLVDISVAAGSGYYNPDQLSEIDCIRFPKSMVKEGRTYLCVRIKGESMVPTLQDGGYLVIRLLERYEWQDVRDGHVYVVSDTDGRAFVKRLKNRLSDFGFIVCMSDNPDVTHYRNFNLMENEINTIWHAEWYISAKMPNIHTTYYNKVSELEDKYDDVITQLQQVQREIRALSQPS